MHERSIKAVYVTWNLARDVIYDTMIHCYCEEDNSFRALKLLKEMDEKGWVPNMATNSSIIGVLCKDG